MSQGNKEAERRIDEARERRAEWLDLGDLGLTEIPRGLADLPHLKALYLGRYGPDETGQVINHRQRGSVAVLDLSTLPELPGLQMLDCAYRNVANLPGLSCLTSLRGLNLELSNVTDLSALSGLGSLEDLNLSCVEMTTLRPLSGLANLRYLDLSGGRSLDLAGLSDLVDLEYLNLSNRKIVNLPLLSGLTGLRALNLALSDVEDLSALGGISGLEKLFLSQTNIENVSFLSRLRELEVLDLSHTQVADLRALSDLHRLWDLNLSFTAIADLSALAGLKSLRRLTANCTKISDVSALSGIDELWHLNINDTPVTDIAPLRHAIGLKILEAAGCRLVCNATDIAGHANLEILIAEDIAGVPGEVLSNGARDNCLPRLRSWRVDLDQGGEAENDVKIILLGNGHVGKTQLCRRLRGEPYDEGIESTHGVKLWRETLPLTVDGQTQTFMANWWDFGGQDIYHGTHALFLRSRAVFLVLWNPRLEQHREYVEDGNPGRNQPLAYWLDYVRSLAGADSPVIVVQSQCDDYEDRVDVPSHHAKFDFLQSCTFSAKSDLGRETLESMLRDAVRFVRQRRGALTIGRGLADLRHRLYAWRDADQRLAPDKRRRRTLTTAQFGALCDDIGGISAWQHALDYCHKTGVVFYQGDLFSGDVILDQDWALDAVYAVFHRKRALPQLRDEGRFTREHLAALVWQQHSVEQQALFLELMQRCGVCFRCGKTADGEPLFVAPDLLPNRCPDNPGRWDADAPTTTLRLVYRFFHAAVIRHYMQQVAQRVGPDGEYWKFGLWFEDRACKTQLRVRFTDTSNRESPGAGVLVLDAQGRDALALLGGARTSILRLGIGEAPDEHLTLDGETVARAALGTAIDGRVLTVDKKPVSAGRFAAFFEGNKTLDAALEERPRFVDTTSDLSKVYISYAWGDDSAVGQMRAQAVDALEQALHVHSFRPMRDRNQVKPGEQISAFLAELTHADRVVALVSDKYLRSSFCMFEMHKLWQKAQAEQRQMLDLVLPVVLPDIRITSLEDRACYIDHWKARADKLDALVRADPRTISAESLNEARLATALSQQIDEILVFIGDVLMPGKLEDHLSNDFQAVRDALRRRARPISAKP